MGEEPIRVIRFDAAQAADAPMREWLVANGRGGYASGTLCGVLMRRGHGLLVAALPPPHGRVVMLEQIDEELSLPDGRTISLAAAQDALGAAPSANPYLKEFRLELGLPVWRFEVEGVAVERRLVLPHGDNTALISYRLLSGADAVVLALRPFMHFRPHDARASDPGGRAYELIANSDRYEITAGPDLPQLRLLLRGEDGALVLDGGTRRELTYAIEAARGHDSQDTIWSPGFFRLTLRPEREAALIASVEPWETIAALRPRETFMYEQERRRRLIAQADPAVQAGLGAELVLAADAFVITPVGRFEEAARVRASGDEPRSVIAGYHWFTEWGRDTMISLEGLALVTGRAREAGWILRTFAHHARDGLIPNLFPEGESEGVYHTADATLWFFQALERYLRATGDRETLRLLLPTMLDIIEHHVRGTRFGIGVDAADGLLRQGQEGYQLTWMDAKVNGWVVTPRRGKAVEINALWYNALCLLQDWVSMEKPDVALPPLARLAERAKRSFNQRFWYAEGGYLYDVVDGEGGDDPACRPNQVFALALSHPVLDRERWAAVMDVVERELLTPFGLRSLARGHPDYKAQYAGNLRARDAAYHQGTVWGWLIGPFVHAWLKLHPERAGEARRFLSGFEAQLDQEGVGTISEIFDAEPPYAPRGCIAQAWSVAEVLRSWRNTKAGVAGGSGG